MNALSGICTTIAVVLGALVSASAIAQEPPQQAPLRIYDATELTPDRYTVLKRLWVDSWGTAFWVSTHKESSAAIAQLSAEAVKIGATALTDVVCLNDQRAWLASGYFCYGLAVKLK